MCEHETVSKVKLKGVADTEWHQILYLMHRVVRNWTSSTVVKCYMKWTVDYLNRLAKFRRYCMFFDRRAQSAAASDALINPYASGSSAKVLAKWAERSVNMT